MPGRAGRNRTRDPFHYWTHTAHTMPDAQALADRLGLDIPANELHGFKCGIVYPIRRLILTGEDNPTNLALLLGPLWETKASDTVKKTRIDVLLCPPPGSPSHTMAQHWDVGAPHWTPRAPSAEEEAELTKVRDMQQQLAGQLGGRQEVGTDDIRQMVMGMGANWADNLGTLEAAMNRTNQGVGR